MPALLLAVLVCLGWRRAAAVLAAFVPLAFLAISLTNGYTLLAGPRGDVTLYAYGLEALILLIAPGTARGWRALQWRPAVLLATATVAAGVGMNGGLWPLFHVPPRVPPSAAPGAWSGWPSLPHGFLGRLFGVGAGEWGDWLLYQGTLVAVIAVALIAMLVGLTGQPPGAVPARGPVRSGGRHLPVQPDQPTAAGIGWQRARREPAAAVPAGRDGFLAGARAPHWTGCPRPSGGARGRLTVAACARHAPAGRPELGRRARGGVPSAGRKP